MTNYVGYTYLQPYWWGRVCLLQAHFLFYSLTIENNLVPQILNFATFCLNLHVSILSVFSGE